MKKLIDIQDNILIELKVLAAKKNMSLKKYIETLIISQVKNNDTQGKQEVKKDAV